MESVLKRDSPPWPVNHHRTERVLDSGELAGPGLAQLVIAAKILRADSTCEPAHRLNERRQFAVVGDVANLERVQKLVDIADKRVPEDLRFALRAGFEPLARVLDEFDQ
jgi:hypothetical protein